MGREAAVVATPTEGTCARATSSTDQRPKPLEGCALTQLSPDDILQSPYVLIGTVDEVVDDLQAHRQRWDISYYVTFEPYMEAFAPVVARLAGR